MDGLRADIRHFLGLAEPAQGAALVVHASAPQEGFTRKAVSYVAGDGDRIEALLFEPHAARASAAVVALHQHHSEWALGKSEIAGLQGDPLQAFGPALARRGVMVLAPDAVGFESRCHTPGQGGRLAPHIERPHGDAEGWLQYYNHAMHRLVRGELLMTKVLEDVALAVSVLQQAAAVRDVGLVGHSYGGNVTLFAAALDERIAFACCSGAAGSYRHKLAHGTGLEMALVIPGFASRFDFDDLMRCVAPRKLLVVSSDDDPFAADAAELVRNATAAFTALGATASLRHVQARGGHALDAERFESIVEWLVEQAVSGR